jgi:hypothetical protein
MEEIIPVNTLAGTIQLGRIGLRSRFLCKTRSEPRAYSPVICKRRTTKLLHKKIKQVRLIRLNRSGLNPLDQIWKLLL